MLFSFLQEYANPRRNIQKYITALFTIQLITIIALVIIELQVLYTPKLLECYFHSIHPKELVVFSDVDFMSYLSDGRRKMEGGLWCLTRAAEMESLTLQVAPGDETDDKNYSTIYC